MDTPVPRKLGTITKQMLTNHEVKNDTTVNSVIRYLQKKQNSL